jgi:hypothetical protein
VSRSLPADFSLFLAPWTTLKVVRRGGLSFVNFT